MGSVSQTTAGTYTWTCPAGVNSITVQCWGGGGSGGSSTVTTGGSGGAGGPFASRVVSVTPGTNYQYVVAGVQSTIGSQGNQSFWEDGTSIMAKGGQGGASDGGARGVGATTGCQGSTLNAGGSGAQGTASAGGGGGGGAGTDGVGGNAGSPGTQSAGTGTATGGGNGGTGSTANSAGGAGSVAGGAGAGGRRTAGGTKAGGQGAQGRVDISWTDPTNVSLMIITS